MKFSKNPKRKFIPNPDYVSPKKHLGQHFLKDINISQDIVNALSFHENYNTLIEIGPGTGVLTQYLVQNENIDLKVIEIDTESVVFLKRQYPDLQIIEGDFLQMNLDTICNQNLGIIGNFPYNISSQIFFKVLDYKEKVNEVVCMLQKEVAERLCAPPGGREYGILSVLLQVWYDMEYLFTVHEHVFDPPPKVKSGVIRVKRNARTNLSVDEALFKKTVKQAFSMRRKTLRNCFKPWNISNEILANPFFDRRAETLSVEEYIELTEIVT